MIFFANYKTECEDGKLVRYKRDVVLLTINGRLQPVSGDWMLDEVIGCCSSEGV